MRARLDDLAPATTLGLLALTTATALSMCRVFPDWQFLQPALAVAIGIHLVAAVLRVMRVHIAIAAPVLVAALIESVSIAHYRSTMTWGLPSRLTATFARADLQTALDQFPTAIAPVSSTGAFAIAATVALALAATGSDLFAFRAHGRIEAVLPQSLVFVVMAAVGTDRNRAAVTIGWITAALLAFALLRFRQLEQDGAWMGGRPVRLRTAAPVMALMAGAVAVAAVGVAPRLPGADAEALLDARNSQDSVTEVVSPLVDIGARIRDQNGPELFSVSSSDGPHYWRLIGLPDFDGSTWEPGEESLTDLSQTASPPTAYEVLSDQLITIAALGGPLVPAAQRPVDVSPDVVLWAAESQSLVLPNSDLQRNDRIAITSAIPQIPAGLLEASSVALAPDVKYRSLPRDIPPGVRSTALTVTNGAVTAYDAVLALQTWFRTEFTYDLSVDYPSSTAGISEFLLARRGFCQQFAATFAVMARSLGIPARVAVGFTPGVLGADGRYHVYGRHAHAWPEVWFDSVGWVAFEPTPGRGNADTAPYTGVDAAQDDTVPQSTVTTTTAADNESSTTAPSTTLGVSGGGSTPSTTSTVTATTDATSHASNDAMWWIVSAFAVLLLWVIVIPRIVRTRNVRHDRSPAARVEAAWRCSIGALSLLRTSAIGGATPIEYSARVNEELDLEPTALERLAALVTDAVYAPSTVSTPSADEAEALAQSIDAAVVERLSWTTRLRLRIDPRLMRRRVGN